ncbi:hypothetical protein BYT27DRAFT_7213790 [Phlegmacium glaucopus]|nr:hypothetical protein BYT27DRAFT_7213790 [Phlegmacium glaucopus]
MAFNLSPEELARFHAYIQQGGSLTPSAPNPAPNPHPPAFQPTQVLAPRQPQSTIFSPSQVSPPSLATSHSQQPSGLHAAQPSIVQPPPISQLYQNIRPHQLGHPATTASRPGTSFNPFLGGAALGLSTAHANQARLASALSTIPRNPSLSRRGRRGPAQHPPALPSSRKVSINSCLSQDASGGHLLRITVKVLPPPHEAHFQYQLYPELRDSVNLFLQQYHLIYRYNLPLDTTVLMLLGNTSQAMQSSPMHHEATPLMLLGLVARGIPRASDARFYSTFSANYPDVDTSGGFLPATIWEPIQVLSPTIESPGLYTIENLSERVYEAATCGISLPRSERRLELEGSSLASLVTAFEEVLGDAVDRGDFTRVLLPQREFSINRPNGGLQTIGPGVEREVIFSAFSKYLQNPSAWFQPYREVVGEWHPELRQTIDSWLAIGASGNVAPFRNIFCSYLNMDPLLEVPKNFAGGANAFFALMWTSAITGYDSIQDYISFMQSPAGLDAAIAVVAGHGATVQSLIEEFLQGSGIPCPTKFDELKGGFSTLIDLDKADTPGFRARVFTWAATGCPTVSPDDAKKIIIAAVPDTNQLYADNNVREMMLANGKISFRTCMGYVHLPASYVTTLASRVYPSASDTSSPFSFKEAFNFWFLTEILSAIGGHNML